MAKIAIPDSFMLGGVSYHRQYRKCNKPECKCHADGSPGHGPYWYRYGLQGMKYVGKELPARVAQVYARRERDLPKLRKIYEREVAKVTRLADALGKQEDARDAVAAVMKGEHVTRKQARALGIAAYVVSESLVGEAPDGG